MAYLAGTCSERACSERAGSPFVCLSGLPRSGSTVLSAILDQNPAIHAEGNSAVCQFIWDMHQSGTVNADEQLKGNGREQSVKDIISQIPKIYYKDIPATKQIIVDTCRSWAITSNVELLRKYIDPQIKIIVLERSVTAIMKSFMKLYKKNKWNDAVIYTTLNALLTPNMEPIMRSVSGIHAAKKDNEHKANKTFLFINYDDLIAKPKDTIQRIYDFCGWAPYSHHFENIVNHHPENDDFYKLNGFHAIRKTLKREENDMVLPPDILAKCLQIDRIMGWGETPQNPPTG
jgi:sulfotransferase